MLVSRWSWSWALPAGRRGRRDHQAENVAGAVHELERAHVAAPLLQQRVLKQRAGRQHGLGPPSGLYREICGVQLGDRGRATVVGGVVHLERDVVEQLARGMQAGRDDLVSGPLWTFLADKVVDGVGDP